MRIPESGYRKDGNWGRRNAADAAMFDVRWFRLCFGDGLVSPDKYELLWRLISIPAALFCGIIAAFLSEIPIAMTWKRHRRTNEPGKKV